MQVAFEKDDLGEQFHVRRGEGGETGHPLVLMLPGRAIGSGNQGAEIGRKAQGRSKARVRCFRPTS